MGLMFVRGLGWAGEGANQAQCPSGQWNPSLNVCCGPGDGTVTAMEDPCSILNNPAFIAQQNSQIQQDIATAGPLEQSTLLALTSVPINIGNDAVRCQSNPGLTFVDSMGVTITCPSASHSDVTTGGQPMSTYSEVQLAQMLNSQYGGTAVVAPGDAAYVTPPTSTVQPTQQQMQTAAPPAGSSAPAGSSPGSTSGSTPGSGSGSTTSASSSSSIDLSFLTDSSLISGLPNWAVAFGAIAALMILPGLIGGRR
jgi:hypothetical protein